MTQLALCDSVSPSFGGICMEYPTMYLRTSLVTTDEWRAAHAKTGSIYFIRDQEGDLIKVGHSRDPWRRLSQLQVWSGNRLRLIGIIAAHIEIESHIHTHLTEGRTHGEWFWDRGVTSKWLVDMTRGEPWCRNVWRFVASKDEP
jgi:hypothetical protein